MRTPISQQHTVRRSASTAIRRQYTTTLQERIAVKDGYALLTFADPCSLLTTPHLQPTCRGPLPAPYCLLRTSPTHRHKFLAAEPQQIKHRRQLKGTVALANYWRPAELSFCLGYRNPMAEQHFRAGALRPGTLRYGSHR